MIATTIGKKAVCGLALLVLVAGAGTPALGDVLGIGEGIGRGIGEGAVEKLGPVLASTVSDVDTRLTKQEDHVGNVIGGVIDKASADTGQRLDQVDGILEKRLLQVQLGVDQVLDQGLDKIDGVARKNINRIDRDLNNRIKQVDGVIQKQLANVDGILDKQIANVNRTITTAIDQTDGVLTARIEQLDEIAGRRLGDVDVIASKQRFGLEQTITRTAWLIGLIIFVVVLLRALWNEYLQAEDQLDAAPHGTERARMALGILGPPLLKHAIVGGVVAALLATVPQVLPNTAAKEQQALIDKHTTELGRSLAALDWTRVRFHASQLEFLDPPSSVRYQAGAAKADLLQDVLEKPTAIATDAGVVSTLQKVNALERLQGGRPDPDGQTVRAMIVWARGATKADELKAASLAARALWSSPRGFTLAPIAHLLVVAYLRAPLPTAVPSSGAGDDAVESVEGLQTALQVPAPVAPGSPFAGLVRLFGRMEELDDESGVAYVRMIEAQARVSADVKDGVNLTDDKTARNAAAERVVHAWERFDTALRTDPVLVSNPAVLAIFRLDDALLTHALWYTTQPDTLAWPVALSALPNDKKGENQRLKLAIAPARAVWARRYVGLLEGPARQLVELQEAQRFEALEQQALLFEQSYGAIAPAFLAETAPAPSKPKASSPDRVATQVVAVSAAAALGLHEGTGTKRTPLADKLSAELDQVKQTVERALQNKRVDLDKTIATKYASLRAAIEAKGPKVAKKLNKQTTDLLEQLRGNLQGRPARLI